MADEADPGELARRFLDLWQDQISALATDPEVAEAMERWVAAMGVAPGQASAGELPSPWAAWPALLAAMAPAAMGGGRGPAQAWGGDGPAAGADAGADAGASAGPTAAAAAPGDGAGDLDELRRRLAALEERIAALEARPRGGGRGARGGPRKRRA